MSGPALNPIASIAPAAPPKGLDASNQDVAAQSEPDKAGTGFASELQRQMKGNPPPDDGQGAKSASDTDTEAAARAEATAQAQPPVQPELAALLGGLIPPVPLPAADLPPTEPAPATPGDDGTALSTDSSALPGGGLFALPASLTPEAIARTPGGNAELQTAESRQRSGKFCRHAR